MDTPQPAKVLEANQGLAPLPYFEETVPALLPIARALGTLAILLGAIEIGNWPLRVFTSMTRMQSASYATPFLIWNTIGSFAVTGVLAVMLLICGVQSARRLPRGRTVFLMWAIAKIVYAGCFIVINVTYVLQYRRASASQIASIGESVRFCLSTIGLPLVVVILFRKRQLIEVFEHAASAMQGATLSPNDARKEGAAQHIIR